jgi:hypothetical protein
MDLGMLTEGVVELDPMTGRMVLRVPQEDGSFAFVDVQAVLERYKGETVRFIVTPLSTVEKLTELVESGQLDPNDLPTVPKS